MQNNKNYIEINVYLSIATLQNCVYKYLNEQLKKQKNIINYSKNEYQKIIQFNIVNGW